MFLCFSKKLKRKNIINVFDVSYVIRSLRLIERATTDLSGTLIVYNYFNVFVLSLCEIIHNVKNA